MQRAIGMVEFTSIARGIYVADQMVKVSEVEIVSSTTSCPGKYITIVTGDVAAVETSAGPHGSSRNHGIILTGIHDHRCR